MANTIKGVYTLTDKELESMRGHYKDAQKRGATDGLSDIDYYGKELRTGNVPGFYSYGKGYFGEKFQGNRPMPVDAGLAGFFAGDLARVTGGTNEWYFAPWNDEFNNLVKDAFKARAVDKVSKDYKLAGSSYGLHPFKRKRTTPFTFDKEKFATFIGGGEGDKGDDVGDRI